MDNLKVFFREVQMGKNKKKNKSIKPEAIKHGGSFDKHFGDPFKKFTKAIDEAGFNTGVKSYKSRFRGMF